MQNLLTEVEVLRYLGERYGTHCGGVEYALQVGTMSTAQADVVYDVHLPIDEEEDIWEHGEVHDVEEPSPDEVGPLLEDFHWIVDEAYEEFCASAALKKQALVDLKLWKETIATREAQQNLIAIEEALHHRPGSNTEEATPSLKPIGGDKSLKRKESWMDRLTNKKRGKPPRSGVKKGHVKNSGQQAKKTTIDVWANLPRRRTTKKRVAVAIPDEDDTPDQNADETIVHADEALWTDKNAP